MYSTPRIARNTTDSLSPLENCNESVAATNRSLPEISPSRESLDVTNRSLSTVTYHSLSQLRLSLLSTNSGPSIAHYHESLDVTNCSLSRIGRCHESVAATKRSLPRSGRCHESVAATNLSLLLLATRSLQSLESHTANNDWPYGYRCRPWTSRIFAVVKMQSVCAQCATRR